MTEGIETSIMPEQPMDSRDEEDFAARGRKPDEERRKEHARIFRMMQCNGEGDTRSLGGKSDGESFVDFSQQYPGYDENGPKTNSSRQNEPAEFLVSKLIWFADKFDFVCRPDILRCQGCARTRTSHG